MNNQNQTAILVTQDRKAYALCEHGKQFTPCEFCSLDFKNRAETDCEFFGQDPVLGEYGKSEMECIQPHYNPDDVLITDNLLSGLTIDENKYANFVEFKQDAKVRALVHKRFYSDD